MSETTNIVTATFSEGCTSVTVDTPLYQYDYGQILTFEGLDLPDAYEVHFSNTSNASGTAKTQIGTADDGVTIPDEYLQTGSYVYAFVYLHKGETDGETEYTVTIPVRKRPSISPEPVTPQQQSVITQAIAALQNAIETAEDLSDQAEESAETASQKAVESVQSALEAEQSATAAQQAADTANEVLKNASIKSNVIGNPIAFTDGADDLPVKDLSVVINANQTSCQIDRYGRNILPNTYSRLTHQGITAVENADGSLTLNGATGTAHAYVRGDYFILKAGTYTINGAPVGGGTNKYRAYIEGLGSPALSADTGAGKTFTVLADIQARYIIQVYANYTMTNLVFYPMIRVATIEDGQYEKYSKTTYTVDLSSADTSTGGVLDVTTGVFDNGTSIYQLTPTEITTLFGVNTFISDGGNITLTYSVDTKGYIDLILGKSDSLDIDYDELNAAINGKFNVAIQTDTHMSDYVGYSSTNEFVKTDFHTLSAITQTVNKLDVNLFANLGDIVRGYEFDPDYETRKSLDKIMNYYDDIATQKAFVIGNHDDGCLYYRDTTYNDNPMSSNVLYPSEQFNRITKRGLNNMGISNYYYADVNGVRVITLYQRDFDYSQSIPTAEQFAISNAQITWLTDTALNTALPVIVLTHTPLLASLYATSRTGFDNALAAINSFVTNGGTVIGVFSGHTHTQATEKVNGVNHIVFANGYTWFNLVTVDLANRTITCKAVNNANISDLSLTF